MQFWIGILISYVIVGLIAYRKGWSIGARSEAREYVKVRDTLDDQPVPSVDRHILSDHCPGTVNHEHVWHRPFTGQKGDEVFCTYCSATKIDLGQSGVDREHCSGTIDGEHSWMIVAPGSLRCVVCGATHSEKIDVLAKPH